MSNLLRIVAPISQTNCGGGWLAYRSGLTGDIFGVQAAVYPSQPLFASGNEGGTLLLTSDLVTRQ